MLMPFLCSIARFSSIIFSSGIGYSHADVLAVGESVAVAGFLALVNWSTFVQLLRGGAGLVFARDLPN